MTEKNKPEVSVCICTYKRPELLLKLLESLAKQTFPLASFEVIVVDNDKSGSANQTITLAAERYPALCVRYAIEPTQGISYARNRTVALATGELLAFVDDDEWVVSHWLADLVEWIAKLEADAVFGPVIPQYPVDTRAWVIKSRFFESSRFKTGTFIKSQNCRTGNALVKACWMKLRQPVPFDERLALSGGEDYDFFKWSEARGAKYIWCDTAEVNEAVPLSRQSLSFILERCFRTSTRFWRDEYVGHSKWWVSRKALTGFIVGTGFFLLGMVLLPSGLGQSLRAWSKGTKGFGRVAALTNVELVGYGRNQ